MAGRGEHIALPSVLGRGATTLVERHCELSDGVESAGRARRVVRQALEDGGRAGWIDQAELVVSEVVTNAVLHAHSPVQLWVGLREEELCVEVRDFNPVLPVRRDYDVEASTGRGMGLVAALTSSCGVHSLGSDGKVVWFCIGDDVPELDADSLLAGWDIDDALVPGDDLRDVDLLSMPVALWLSARQHHDAIVRELVLYLAEHPDLRLDVAAADAARASISTALLAEIDVATASGKLEPAPPAGHPGPRRWRPSQLDVHLRVPTESAADFAAMQDVLDAAERLAVEGELLIRPALPEVIAVRDWACEQAIAQLSGNAPAPWPGTDQERFERDVHDRAEPAAPVWDMSQVTHATTGAIAADDANRIIAISAPLAGALGWEPEDLVGRRVVTVVPPSLREAHVAGFSRHLNTGETHALGVPLELPVLRRDGTEILCNFLVERADVAVGRPVYIAWIDPVEGETR